MSSYKFSSVGTRFKKQLADLMAALHTMEPHYIRCIKPNSKNQPMDFEDNNVLHQLRCGGVLEAVHSLSVIGAIALGASFGCWCLRGRDLLSD